MKRVAFIVLLSVFGLFGAQLDSLQNSYDALHVDVKKLNIEMEDKVLLNYLLL